MDDSLTKVVLVTQTHGSSYVETPWAQPLGDSRYRLDNVPFFAYGVSLDDVIEATPHPDDPRPHFRRVIEKSGNRTLRLAAPDHSTTRRIPQELLDHLTMLGCSYEGANPGYVAVNVPSRIDLSVVVTSITSHGQEFEYADPSYDQLHGGNDGAA